MDVVEQIASIAVAALGIVAAAWAGAKWLRRPRFICGIPPSISERAEKGIDRDRLGHDSVATAFRHRADCFAKPFHRPHRGALSRTTERRLLGDRARCRSIAVDRRGRARIPVLIANRGYRVADYIASFTFYADDGKVHVADVVTETLEPYVYADRGDRVAPRVRRADPRIVRAYNAYLMDDRMKRWGDVIAFTGGYLDASLFELVVVDVEVEEDLDFFFVVYSLDCADAWTGARTFIQACRVVREELEPAAGSG